MRTWIVRAVVALTSALVAAPAFALPGTTGDVEWPVELTFGSCSVVRVDAFAEMDGNAYVGVKKNDAYYFPALTYWEYFEGNWEKTELGVSNLTEAIIASCLGTDPTDVSSLNNVDQLIMAESPPYGMNGSTIRRRNQDMRMNQGR